MNHSEKMNEANGVGVGTNGDTTATTTTTTTTTTTSSLSSPNTDPTTTNMTPYTTTKAPTTTPIDLETLIPAIIPVSLSTSGLEQRLRQLRDASTQHSQTLTQKLASSQSGQNLLHMGSALSTLPPDIQNLMTQLQPFLTAVEQAEQEELQRLEHLVATGINVQHKARRIQQAQAAANLFADLNAAEQAVELYLRRIRDGSGNNNNNNNKNEASLSSSQTRIIDIDLIAPLERAAHLTTCLLADLNAANEQVRSMTTTHAHRSTSISIGSKEGGNPRTQDASSSSRQQQQHPPMVPTWQAASASSIEQDTELAQFLLRLAPRIRRFESNTVKALLRATEDLLVQLPEIRSSVSSNNTNERSADDQKQLPQVPLSGEVNPRILSAPNSANGSVYPATLTQNGFTSAPNSGVGVVQNDVVFGAQVEDEAQQVQSAPEVDLLIMLGHCMRGLAILGRGAEVESIFARVAIMPVIRAKVSMGRLDQGGARGECKGLFSLLEEMVDAIQQTYGPVLCLGETMFYMNGDDTDDDDGTTPTHHSIPTLAVDLITAGVWVPIVTALMADSAIKMAIFSPGIASVLQANYVALDSFLSELAARLLKPEESTTTTSSDTSSNWEGGGRPHDLALMQQLNSTSSLFFTQRRISRTQDRIYAHPKTAEFSKRWNLPIYYQLRFGESCARLNKAVDLTTREGWIAEVFTGTEDRAKELKNQSGFELSLFLEFYDVLSDLWKPDVVLRPLAKRFLRGSVQLIGRTISFISDSMEGKIPFGQEPEVEQKGRTTNDEANQAEIESSSLSAEESNPPTRTPYCWGDSEDDVAAVTWELAILQSSLETDYVDRVCEALQAKRVDDGGGTAAKAASDVELRSLITDLLVEASAQIYPVIDKGWNEIIVQLLTAKCSGPLSAVKGVAVMYRMTNRPPPTQPSSFVATIFRPLKDFCKSFRNRTPERIGAAWKHQIVTTVSERYAAAVDELLTTVQRTEVALRNRAASRRMAAGGGGGMSDGEKLKLQLYLDYECFHRSIRSEEVGVDPATVEGLSKLKELTAEGAALHLSRQSSSSS